MEMNIGDLEEVHTILVVVETKSLKKFLPPLHPI